MAKWNYGRTETDLHKKTTDAYINSTNLNRIITGMEEVAINVNVDIPFVSEFWRRPSSATSHLKTSFPTLSDMDIIISNLNTFISTVQSRRDFVPPAEVPTTLDKATIYTVNNLERIMAEIESIADEYYTDIWVGTNQSDKAFGKIYAPYNIAPYYVDDEKIHNDTDGRVYIWNASHAPYAQEFYDGEPIDIGNIYNIPFYVMWKYRSPNLLWGDSGLLNDILGDVAKETLYPCTKIDVLDTETLTIDDTVNNYTGEYTRYRLYFNLD